MASEGVALVADLDRIAVLGIAEIARSLPFLLRLRRRVRRLILREKVDLLVPIDYPGFNLPLSAWAHRRGIRVLYYIAPQIWAWRPGRARSLAVHTDRVCVVLPFEREFLSRYGVKADFVGHPLLDRETRGDADASGTTRILGLFPGSRTQEVRRLLPTFLSAADRIRRALPAVSVRVARAAELSAGVYQGCDPALLEPSEELIGRTYVAITKSGTITLELALAGVPMVVGYALNPVSYGIARRLVRVPYISLVNLVEGRSLVPEMVQSELTPERLAAHALPLFRSDGAARAEMVAGFTGIRRRLGMPGSAARVARYCLELLESP